MLLRGAREEEGEGASTSRATATGAVMGAASSPPPLPPPQCRRPPTPPSSPTPTRTIPGKNTFHDSLLVVTLLPFPNNVNISDYHYI